MKYWIVVDGNKIGDFETDALLPERMKSDMMANFSKEIGIRHAVLQVEIIRAQTQKDFPIYKMRQGNG